MSPRPKRSPDSTVIDAAARVVAERGTSHTRLSDVAAASGFAAATLVQRFGSREGLLHAVGEAQIARIQQAFAIRTSSHLERIGAALEQLFADGHIAFLLAHKQTGPPYSVELRKWIGQSLAVAIDSGELSPCDVAAHARRIQLGFYGLAVAAMLEGNDHDLSSTVQSMVSDLLADFM